MEAVVGVEVMEEVEAEGGVVEVEEEVTEVVP